MDKENGAGSLVIRDATPGDTPLLFAFVRELAEYEHMSEQVDATEESLRQWMFEQNIAQALIAEWEGQPVGFALYFHNFSTFKGCAGLYLEDLYVHPAMRKKGIGKALIRRLAKIAVRRGCGRLEWSCLDWNKPSIDFYLSLGARPMNEWTVYRVADEALCALAAD